MANETVVREPNKFKKSVGAGMKSVLNTGGRTFFNLEFKTPTKKHRPGDTKEIIIDYIEMGRDKKCQVRFDSSHDTVSRRHAAIAKDGTDWIIKQLSETNPTLVNGRPISKQWYLQNGDEIQLSYEGPKLGFLIPSNNNVGTIGVARRLTLFGQQALRPYRQAIIAMSVIFILGLGTMGYFLWQNHNTIKQQRVVLQQMVSEADNYEVDIDSLHNALARNRNNQLNLQRELAQLQTIINDMPRQNEASSTRRDVQQPQASLSLDQYFASVYYIRVKSLEVERNGSSEIITDFANWTGTGFLLDDKRFITARHVIDSWMYYSDAGVLEGNPGDLFSAQLNKIANNGGTVIAHFEAFSPDGSVLNFKSSDFRTDTSGDQASRVLNSETGEFTWFIKASLADGKDWASLATNKTGTIAFDNERAGTLRQQEQLHILGYPLSLGVSNEGISPIYGNCTVSTQGLSNGVILVSDRNFEPGNSGGPVFYRDGNQYHAVGIVSAGTGETTGFIIPISSTR